jgi:hypothetical protein
MPLTCPVTLTLKPFFSSRGMENGRGKMTLDSDIATTIFHDTNTDSCVEINGEKRKLIIHFDLRNTILVSDSVTNVSMEQALNSFLTGVVWGKVKSDSSWQWHSYTPSLTIYTF